MCVWWSGRCGGGGSAPASTCPGLVLAQRPWEGGRAAGGLERGLLPASSSEYRWRVSAFLFGLDPGVASVAPVRAPPTCSQGAEEDLQTHPAPPPPAQLQSPASPRQSPGLCICSGGRGALGQETLPGAEGPTCLHPGMVGMLLPGTLLVGLVPGKSRQFSGSVRTEAVAGKRSG